MSSIFRFPVIIFSALSIVLSVAVLACSGRSLYIFNTQQSSNPWLLPIWPKHFDIRDLQALAGTSAVILVLNTVLILSNITNKVRTSI